MKGAAAEGSSAALVAFDDADSLLVCACLSVCVCVCVFVCMYLCV